MALRFCRNAGAALYRAKTQGGNNYQFYTADMNSRALKRLWRVRPACAAPLKMMSSYFTTNHKIDFSSRVQLSVREALIRWQHTRIWGLVQPL